jgi:hypothetical protein
MVFTIIFADRIRYGNRKIESGKKHTAQSEQTKDPSNAVHAEFQIPIIPLT